MEEKKYIESEMEIEGRVVKLRVPIIRELPPWKETAIVGKEMIRYDAFEKITGFAKYTIDLNFEEMGYGKILRSPYPCAEVKKIDLTKAMSYPGVLAIITYEDCKDYFLKAFNAKMPLLTKEIKYAGEEIAALVAVDPYIAEEAIKLIEVEYEQKPFVIDPIESLNSQEIKFFPEGNFIGGGYGRFKIGEPNVYQRGDIEKGFKEADVIIESTYTTAAAQHACMEVHCSVAIWKDDKLIVWDSTQGVYGVQEALSNTLNIPLNKIRVIGTYMGGGFGSKSTAHKHTIIACILSKMINKPVKIVLDRSEDFISPFYRPSSIQYLKAGVKKNGILTALYLKAIHQIGAYVYNYVWGNCSTPVKELYKCENVKTEDYAVFTNTPPPSAMRAPGHTQGIWALEQFMDEIAAKIKIDPLELRKLNYADSDPVSGKEYASKGLNECIQVAVEESRWASFRSSKENKTNHIKRGIGAALQIWGGGGGPPASAIIKINEDGSVNLITGAADIGTGTKTVLCQIAAEELGIPLSNISIINADTEFTTYTLPSYGSITLASSGPAVRNAANDAKLKLLEFASGFFNSNPEDLDIKDGVIFLKKKKSISKRVSEITSYLPNKIIIGEGLRGPNPDKVLRTFGIQIAEVEVNTRTGEIKIIKITAVHDCGKIINPKTWKNQIYGGIYMGIGYALSEERLYDKQTGLHLNPTFADYKIPTIKDIPIEIIILNADVPYEANSIGAKGAGEPPIIPTAAAIANAIYDAIEVRIKSTPITPDKILEALYKTKR